MKKIEELKISPTPWSVSYDCDIPQICVDGGRGVILDKTWDCEGGYFVGFDEPELRLIAAAPDMYKTEYDLVDVIERLLNGWCGTCDTPSQDEVVAALEAAKEALAKAAGEEATE